jgi:hypothetical protein
MILTVGRTADAMNRNSGRMKYWASGGSPKNQKTAPAKGDFVFRGDERKPSKIFNEGFKAKGNNMNLETHVKTNPPNDGFIATSKSPKVAASGDYGDYVYTIKNKGGGRDVNKEMPNNKYSYEMEIAIPDEISHSDILGVRMSDGKGKFKGLFIYNPNYKPEKE